MRIGAVWVVGLVSVVLGACTQGASSERVVQSNLPGDTKAAGAQEPNAPTTPAKSAPASPRRADEPRLTSQDVEKELNRLEAELGQRR
jgi:hypothetical protein